VILLEAQGQHESWEKQVSEARSSSKGGHDFLLFHQHSAIQGE
jgi:hypothetical protein